MSDGVRLRQSWYNALNEAEASFRRLVTSNAPGDWKRISVPLEDANGKGKRRATEPRLSDIVIHRGATKKAENVYRIILDVSLTEDAAPLDCWKAVLVTPELRKEWDPAVEGAQLVEMFDPSTRIAKTNFTLGWPANPRDAVTISRTFSDATTVIDISTSLPRSPDEPAYLRPSPPYVRSDVKLLAWCIQLLPSSPDPVPSPARSRMRITCFWQHDLKALWTLNSASALTQQLGAMALGLHRSVQKRGRRVPLLAGYGNGITIERIRFEIDREALTVDYAIHPDEEHQDPHVTEGLEHLHAIREARRLTRAVECELLSPDGWEIHLTTKASRASVAQLPWTANAIRTSPTPSSPSSPGPNGKPLDKILFSFRHAALPDAHSILKVRLAIEFSGASSGLRLNGLPQTVEEHGDRDPAGFFMSQQMLQDASSTADVSFLSGPASSVSTSESAATGRSATTERPDMVRTSSERSTSAEKSILSRVKRNYIYFSSLLQEPEQKWKHTTDGRGVEVTQLDSIDPTLVVYRAEATFVGVGLWDLYATIMSPGARVYWDKQHEDANLVEDVNELSELWHFKTKPAWPVVGRDSAVLRTVYKSPTAVHVFMFSADDLPYFPSIPAPQPNVIRTQIDLQGWSIEALSPTTTSITLIEQSDPKGWSNKASIPQQLVNTIAGIGEYAIKCGGPPVATRLAGARATEVRYDHERALYRIAYQGSPSRRAKSDMMGASSQMPVIECELRCDVDSWSASLDIVVDPPPQGLACLRRHKLSEGGGGLWLTITHDAVFAGDERILVIVKKGPGKEKGLVMVNGAKVTVDMEDLPEAEVKSLAKKKRVKPARIPLDQPPVLGAIRRRNAEWDAEDGPESPGGTRKKRTNSTQLSQAFVIPKFTSPLSKFFTNAVESTTAAAQQAVAAMSPPAPYNDGVFPASQAPMHCALNALAHVKRLYPLPNPDLDDWALVSDKGFPVRRRLCPDVSPTIMVHRGEKVIEGVAAEEVAAAVTTYGCRKQWDDRFDSASVFESFGAGCQTAFLVSKGGFPFRDRGFYLASILARTTGPPSPSRRNSGLGIDHGRQEEERAIMFYVSASFNPESVASFAPSKYNSYNLPIGRVVLDGWVLETLDPYGTENYAIPSTRCTRIVTVDYAGSIPAAVNSMINAALPRSILALETYMKKRAPLPCARLPQPCVLLSNKNENADGDAWALRQRDERRRSVTTSCQPDARKYRGIILISLSSPAPALDDVTPRPSRLPASPTRALSTELPRRKGSVSSVGLPRDLPQQTLALPSRAVSPATPPIVHVRERTGSSGFTARGEIRPPTDFVVAETIVDAKVYPEGFGIRLSSQLTEAHGSISLPSPQEGIPNEKVLPLSCTIYTLPPSGLNADTPSKHLVRLSLPTAQYQVPTILDPLTGEIRSAPPKPEWLLELESGRQRAVVHVEVQPAPSGAKRAKGQGQGSASVPVSVDECPVTVLNEKESLKALGRDDLQDEGITKLAVLSRTTDGDESVPEALRIPTAVSRALLDPSSSATSVLKDGAPSTLTADILKEAPGSDAASEAQTATGQSTPAIPESTPTGGILGFLNSYSTPLMRLSSLSPRASPIKRTSSSTLKTEPGSIAEVPQPPGGLAVSTATTSAGPARALPSYPLSSVLVVAIIAFLLGSLLRSLLSPAEFVYVVRDVRDAEDPESGGQWREIKRLLEVKYIAGGWDFQVAVVRRQ